jgi:flagellar basal-body rod protein FlgB
MAISFDSALGVHEQALSVRSRRAEVLANNLANVDTPSFKARDIDFKGMLQQQVNASSKVISTQSLNMRTLQMRATQGGHISEGPVSDSADGDLLYRTPTQPSVDGNTVDENIEQAEYMKNALNWQASFQFLSAKFKGLKDAIRGE